MANSSYLSHASRMKLLGKAGIAIPNHRVLSYGTDVRAYMSSLESGRIFGVSNKECAGSGSGVSYTTPDNPAVFTAGAAITVDDSLIVLGTGSGLVGPYNSTGFTYEPDSPGTGNYSGTSSRLSEYIKNRNCVGFALEAAAASGDTFLGWFQPKGW